MYPPVLREGVKKDGPVITDNMNFIIDAKFKKIQTPKNSRLPLASFPALLRAGSSVGFTEKTTVIVGGEKKCRIIP